MPTITSYLITEHAVFSTLFDEIERLLAKTTSAREAHQFAQLVEGVLTHHRDIEANLAFSALDQQLAERGELDQLHRDHKEIDDHLQQAQATTDHAGAKRLLQTAIRNTRVHFRREEETVFPLFDRIFMPGTLEALGDTTIQTYLATRRTPLVPESAAAI
jgi:hypothetical protein